MKKTFNVIPIEDYFVAVEDKSIITKGTKFIYRMLPEIHTAGYDKEDNDGLRRIIATIGKRIEQLPLIELPKDEWGSIHHDEVLAEECRKYIRTKYPNLKGMDAVMAIEERYNGYKAAQSKGIYSEEDMWRAAIFGYDTANNNASKDGTQMTGEEFKAFIKSLQKKPISVELEMEEGQWHTKQTTYDQPDREWFEKYDSPKLKINKETNTITPISIKYND